MGSSYQIYSPDYGNNFTPEAKGLIDANFGSSQNYIATMRGTDPEGFDEKLQMMMGNMKEIVMGIPGVV